MFFKARRAEQARVQAARAECPPRSDANASGVRPGRAARVQAGETVMLAVGPAVLRDICAAASRAAEHETGGPLFGTVEQSWDGGRFRPLVSVLGTVPPGPSLRSSPASVALGFAADGERSASALRWLREVTGLDLVHVGDWHLHPSGCPEASEGDRRTAQALLAVADTQVWLVAVCVRTSQASDQIATSDSVVRVSRAGEDGHELRFCQAVSDGGLVRIDPAVDGRSLPALPPLPWHITDPGRFWAECRLLQAAGFSVALKASVSADGEPQLEFAVRRRDGSAVLLSTSARYPLEPPLLRSENGTHMGLRTPWAPSLFLADALTEVP